MNYEQWAKRHPEAAAELAQIHTDALNEKDADNSGKSESWAQQQIRFKVARLGGLLWRNNVGATPAKTDHHCPRCHFDFEQRNQPTRYGLCNESHKQNNLIKSADLIGIMPVTITQEMVGTKIGQFISFEAKKPDWTYNPNDPHTAGQAAWSALVRRYYGYATFSRGDV